MLNTHIERLFEVYNARYLRMQSDSLVRRVVKVVDKSVGKKKTRVGGRYNENDS